jgi:DNA repair exonuclease SbcCD ATPase subunit
MIKKMEKLVAESEFQRQHRQIDSLKDWCERLEEMIRKLQSQVGNFVTE